MIDRFVCISYALDDAPEAAELASVVRATGWDVCFTHVVEPAREVEERSSRLLSEAASVIVIWSSNASSSTILRREVQQASYAAKLVLVVLDDAAPPLPLANIAVLVDWRGGGAPANRQCLIDGVTRYAGNPRKRSGRIVSDATAGGGRVGLTIGGVALLACSALLGVSFLLNQPPESQLASQVEKQLPEESRSPVPRPELRRSSGDAMPRSLSESGDQYARTPDASPTEIVGNSNQKMGWEEAAWQGMLTQEDLMVRLADLVNFRIDFPEGRYAPLAARVEIEQRDALLKVQTDLSHLGYLTSSPRVDEKTLRRAFASFERSVGLLPSGRLTESSISALRVAAELTSGPDSSRKSHVPSPRRP